MAISTDDAVTSLSLELPVAGATSTTGNLFTSNLAKTINLGTGTAVDTLNIATDPTAGDIIAIGNNNASTTLSLTGGNDWSVTVAGVATFAQVLVDNLGLDANTLSSTGTFILDSSDDIQLDADGADILFQDGGATFATFTNSSNDLVLDLAGGQLFLANGDTLNLGGDPTGRAYHAISDSTAASFASTDVPCQGQPAPLSRSAAGMLP